MNFLWRKYLYQFGTLTPNVLVENEVKTRMRKGGGKLNWQEKGRKKKEGEKET